MSMFNSTKRSTVRLALALGAMVGAAGTMIGGCPNNGDAPPVISPNTGTTAGGTEVTILGSGFSAQTAVLFGNTSAQEVVFVNPGLLRVKTPAMPAGTVDVQFRTSDVVNSIVPQAFTFVEPPPEQPDMTFATIAPDSGSTQGGTRVTITGEHFAPGMVVLFGGFLGTNVAVVNSQVLSVDAPAQGEGVVDVVLIRPDGDSLVLAAAFTYERSPVRLPGGPRVVSAISTSNTTVRVTFNESVADGADDASNYSIVQLNQQPEAGVLLVSAAAPSVDGTSVTLTTFPQNELTYLLTVTNIKDVDGNPLAPPDILVNPTQAVFAGTPPLQGGVDQDGDGLPDNEEQRGWVVFVQLVNGTIVSRDVTSDPTKADSDSDGLSDFDERAIGIDPRSADTDGDQVADADEWNEWYSDPTAQDSDGDSLSDSLEIFFKTSMVLADTDGDQISDDEEIIGANRNPRISDLPKPRIDIGNIALNLDVRFTYTDTQGSSQSVTESQGSTLTEGTEQTFATSNEDSTKASIEASTELEVSIDIPKGGGVTGTFGLKTGFEQGHTTSVSEESKESSEQAFEQSLSTTAQVDQSRSVTREVVGASMLTDVTLQNISTTAFTISNIELTALAQDPRNRKNFLPIASLRPQNPNFAPVNLGPLGLVSERGPFVFEAVQVFPQQVEDLMKNPRGLIVKLANFDITDELGRNFAFTSQTVFDRTAGLSIDYGDGRLETFRIATNSTFDEFGESRGITMAFALQDILRLKTGDAIRDGGNMTCESTAANDDIQVVPVGNAVPADGIVVRAGPDGVLDTTPGGDDATGGTGYETTFVDRDVNGVVTPVQILTRVKDVKSGFADDPQTPPPGDLTARVLDETRTFWVVFSDGALTDNALNFDEIVIKSGDQFAMTFVQDKDADQVYAQEEFMYGSSDRNPNTDGCPNDDLSTPQYDGTCMDRTFDLLTDYEEIKEGWVVQVEGRTSRRVYSDPVQPDSDGDMLLDHEERDCGLDARQRDTDEDGLTDYEELTGYNINQQNGLLVFTVPFYEGQVILDGGNGIAETTVDANDVAATGTLVKGGIVVFPGTDGVIDSTPGGDDFIGADHPVIMGCIPPGQTGEGYGSNPLNADTDGDGITDGAEFNLRINPNNPFDGARFRDADQDGVPDFFETNGFETVVNGSMVTYTSDPFDPDSDDDRLPDLLEHKLGTNPQNVDTDGDGLSDFDEFDGPDTCVTSAVPCGNFAAGWGEFVSECQDADNCEFTLLVLDDFGSRRLGTNPKHRDTDGDTLEDDFELDVGWNVSVNGGVAMNKRPSPFTPNSDVDGWNDNVEFSNLTDPTEEDTDGDGALDNAEGAICAGANCRSPLFSDQKITFTYTTIEVSGDCDAADNDGEFNFSLRFKRPTDASFFQMASQNTLGFPACQSGDDQGCINGDGYLLVDNNYTVSVSASESFIARTGQVFQMAGFVQEIDDGADASLRYGPSGCDCGFAGSIDVTANTSFAVPTTAQTYSWSKSGNCGNVDEQSYTWTVFGTVSVE